MVKTIIESKKMTGHISPARKLSDKYSGHRNLEVIARNHRFNEWVYKQIFPGLRGDILEVGSGTGTFSEKIIADMHDSKIALTDVSLAYVNGLQQRFCSNNSRLSTHKLDLNCEEDYKKIGYQNFDSIVAINVLEHVEKDEFALQQLYRMLRKEGLLVILVPCHKFLYNAIDSNIGHFRRYTKREIESKVKRTSFTIDRLFYFNILGIVGWYVAGSIAKTPNINGTAFKLFDSIVPLLIHIDKFASKFTGLSIICFLKKV